MGKKWIYRLKKEDFANVAQRPYVTLDGKLEDMTTYHDKAGPSITLTNAEGDNLVASLCVDNLQKEANRRDSSQDRKVTALISRPSQSDYARIAKQVREWSFRFAGAATVQVPGVGGMVRQHIRLGVRHDYPSDAGIT